MLELDEIYAEHGNHSYFDFWLFDEEKSRLSDEEFSAIVEAARAWSVENEIPCELTRIEDGFQAHLVHLCGSGAGFGSELFMELARSVFRRLEIGIAYGPRRDIPIASE